VPVQPDEAIPDQIPLAELRKAALEAAMDIPDRSTRNALQTYTKRSAAVRAYALEVVPGIRTGS
jgi:hypothetical protein